MCLPVSCLFWVSSLAYPNLLGTKGYVVVVVVFWVNLSQNLAGQGETSNPRGRTGRRAEVAAGMQGEKERALVAAGSQAHREKRGRW
jgi:hypothetical protein